MPNNAASPARVLHCRITDAYHGRLKPNVTDLAELVRANTAPGVVGVPARPCRGGCRHRRRRRRVLRGWAPAWSAADDESRPARDAPTPAMAEKAALFRAAHRELELLDMTAEEAP